MEYVQFEHDLLRTLILGLTKITWMVQGVFSNLKGELLSKVGSPKSRFKPATISVANSTSKGNPELFHQNKEIIPVFL